MPTGEHMKAKKGLPREKVFVKASINPAQCFQAFAKMEKPRSLRKLHEQLIQAGERIAYVTITKWAKEWEWRERLDEAPLDFKMDPINILGHLTKEAEYLTPPVIKGLQHRLAMQIARQIEMLVLDNPSDLERAVKVMADLDEAYQRHRGMSINNAKIGRAHV